MMATALPRRRRAKRAPMPVRKVARPESGRPTTVIACLDRGDERMPARHLVGLWDCRHRGLLEEVLLLSNRHYSACSWPCGRGREARSVGESSSRWKPIGIAVGQDVGDG